MEKTTEEEPSSVLYYLSTTIDISGVPETLDPKQTRSKQAPEETNYQILGVNVT